MGTINIGGEQMRKLLALAFISLALLGITCSEDDVTGDQGTRVNAQHASAQTAGSLNALIRTAWENTYNMSGSATYDADTGYWNITVVLVTGETTTMQLQFRDSSGSVQQFYNPQTTVVVYCLGTASGYAGSISFDLAITGVQEDAANLVVNGTGTFTYVGLPGTYTINGLAISKDVGAYPEAGNVTIRVWEITVTIQYNGTRYATATYSWGNLSYSFTIDLEAGDVTG